MYDEFSRNTFRLLTGAHRSDAYFLKISNWDCLQYNIVALFDIFNGRFYVAVEFSRANRCGTEYRREINGVSRFSRVTKSSPPYGETRSNVFAAVVCSWKRICYTRRRSRDHVFNWRLTAVRSFRAHTRATWFSSLERYLSPRSVFPTEPFPPWAREGEFDGCGRSFSSPNVHPRQSFPAHRSENAILYAWNPYTAAAQHSLEYEKREADREKYKLNINVLAHWRLHDRCNFTRRWLPSEEPWVRPRDTRFENEMKFYTVLKWRRASTCKYVYFFFLLKICLNWTCLRAMVEIKPVGTVSVRKANKLFLYSTRDQSPTRI